MTDFTNTMKNLVSFSEFNKGQAGKIFKSVKESGAKLVMKNKNPECVLLSPEQYTQMMDEINDTRLLLEATMRVQNFDENKTFSQAEINEMFGLKQEEIEDNDEVEIE